MRFHLWHPVQLLFLLLLLVRLLQIRRQGSPTEAPMSPLECGAVGRGRGQSLSRRLQNLQHRRLRNRLAIGQVSQGSVSADNSAMRFASISIPTAISAFFDCL